MRIRTASERKDQGFTLIELLVVVVIIGILAAIAVPVFLNQRAKAADAAAKSDLKNAATAQEAYLVDNPSGYSDTAGLDSAGFRESNNVTFAVVARNAYGYCMSAKGDSSDNTWFYNSVDGGILDEDVACTAADLPTAPTP